MWHATWSRTQLKAASHTGEVGGAKPRPEATERRDRQRMPDTSQTWVMDPGATPKPTSSTNRRNRNSLWDLTVPRPSAVSNESVAPGSGPARRASRSPASSIGDWAYTATCSLSGRYWVRTYQAQKRARQPAPYGDQVHAGANVAAPNATLSSRGRTGFEQ